MADSPFPSNSNSAPLLFPGTTEKSHIFSLDNTIEQCLADFGWGQLLQTILVSLAWFFDAQQAFISIFTDAEPSWHCTQLGTESCNSSSNICQLPRTSWAWDSSIATSIISEWDLECFDPIVTGLPASSFFAGCLAGGFLLATLADSSLGRKNMLAFSCLSMSMSGVLTIFSTNIWMYSLLRFISGFCRATIGTSAIVLTSECVGKRWRGRVGVIGFFCFTLGFLSLPAIAYLNRDYTWRIMYIFTSIPTTIYSIVIYFLVLESPRWLFVRGRKEEAVAALHGLAPTNQVNIFKTLTLTRRCNDISVGNNVQGLYSSLIRLFNRRWALRRLFAVMVSGFGIGMTYYGIPLGVGNLRYNLYLTTTFNALAEVPASLVTFFVIDLLNRRGSFMAFTSISGVCSILCVVMGKNGWSKMEVVFEIISFFTACTSLNIILIYTIELFPTCARNSTLSMVRQATVLGGVVAPLLVAAGRGNGYLSYGVFGVGIGFCGLFVGWCPETRGVSLSDSMDEQEYKEGVGNIM